MFRTLEVTDMALVKASPEEIERLKRKLVVTNTYKDFSLECYRMNGDKSTLYIPRALVKKPPMDREWAELKCQSKIVLTDYQTRLVRSAHAVLKESQSGVILQAPTGTGKTIMGIQMACDLGLKTLIISPRERITKQWIDRIKQFTTSKEVGLIQGGYMDLSNDFTVAMLQTISKERFERIKDEFGTVIFDEVHTIPTEHFSSVASRFWCKTRIGLSATPNRRDGMDNVFLWHIGKVVGDDQDYATRPRVYMLEFYDPSITDKGCFRYYTDDFIIHRFIKKLIRSTARNELIGKIVLKQYKKGHDILILTDSIAHVNVMTDNLRRRADINNSDIGILTASRKEVDKRIIVGTYGSAGLGLDIPRLSCLIFASPRSDVVQATGRILRKGSMNEPVVIDIVDVHSAVSVKWAKKRMNFYNKIAKSVVRTGV